MDLLDQLRGNFPKTIDKKNPVFSALIANANGTGAIQEQLEYLFKYMKEWISTPDVYEQTGVMLQKTINFFSFLEPFADETEASLKNRFRAIFVRNHDTKWGTPYDVKNVFREYFPHAEIFLIENVNKIDSTEPGLANLIKDGDITTDATEDWILSNCIISEYARFSKAYGIEFDDTDGVLTQEDIAVQSSKPYFLHFFLKGGCNVIIKDNNDKYWNFTTKEWDDSEVKNSFTTEIRDSLNNIIDYKWDNRSLWFITAADTSSVTISFEMDGIGQRASVELVFSLDNAVNQTTTIPAGTIVSDSTDTYLFTTREDTIIEPGEINSKTVWADAEEFGLDYILGDNTVTKIQSDLPATISVTNPKKVTGGTYADYFRLFWKQPYGSFSIIAHFEGNTSVGAFGLAPGDDDPNPLPQPRYSNYGYYDKSFLSGVPIGFASDIYEDLLDYLRAQGVRAFFDIVIKDA